MKEWIILNKSRGNQWDEGSFMYYLKHEAGYSGSLPMTPRTLDLCIRVARNWLHDITKSFPGRRGALPIHVIVNLNDGTEIPFDVL